MRVLTAAVAAALVLLPAAPAWAANQAPVAVDDAVNIRSVAGIDVLVGALVNDSDPEGDPLTYTAVSAATKGATSLQGGKLFYRPTLGNSGPDSFTYTVTDGQGNTATGSVSVTLWLDLPAPSGLTMTGGSTSSASLSWPAATGAVQYQIFRNTVLVQTTSALTWTDTGLESSRQYEYRIASVNGGGWGGPQSTAVYRQPQAGTPPLLAVNVNDDPTGLSLVWSPEYGGRWNVYRDGALVATTTIPGFTDTGLVTGRTYSYQVQTAGYAYAIEVYPASELSPAVRGTPSALSAIGQLFWDLGSSGGVLGAVTVPERAIPGGRQQDHARGIILQQDGAQPVTVRTDFATAYAGVGGATGALGFPLDESECGLRDYGCGQLFERGSIWSSLSTPTRVVRQVMEDGWAASGWEGGPLGYPVANQSGVPGGGISQAFEDGAVYWTAATGSHGVGGPFADLYDWAGGPTSGFGYPTSDEDCALPDGGCYQQFQGTSMYWSPTSGAHLLYGGIRAAWARAGSEWGRLGYPITNENCGLRDGGCYQVFQGGTIIWSPTSGAHLVVGTIRDAWTANGLQNGGLGYPTTDEICGLPAGGCYQLFQGGSIYSSAASGTHLLYGGIRAAWMRGGSEWGQLGYPTTDETCGLRGGGCSQQFQGGAIYWSPASGAHLVHGTIRDAWAANGAQNGGLGYPTTDVTCGLRDGGCYQLFQGASIYWSAAGGTHLVFGALRDAWVRTGSEWGRLGYPTSDEWFSDGAYRQTFQGGTVTYAAGKTQIAYR